MNRILLFLFLNFPNILCSQDKIVLDSLQLKLQYSQDNAENVKTLLEISKFHWKDDLAKSMVYSEQALVLATEMENPSLLASAHYMQGGTRLQLGDLGKGLEHYLKSLKLYKEMNDLGKIIETNQSIGVLYGNLKDYGQALEFFHKAISLYNENSNEVGNPPFQKIYAVYINVGTVYGAKGEERTALEYYQKGLELAEAQGEYKDMGSIYFNLAKSHFNLNEFETALKYIQKSLEVGIKTGDKMGIALCNIALGNYYITTEELQRAENVIQMALEQGKQVGSLQIQESAYQLLSLVYERMNQHDKSLEAYKLYKSTNDSWLNEKTIREITKAKMQFEFSKKEKIAQMVQQKMKYKYSLVISLLILGVVIISLLYSLLKMNNKRMRLEGERILLEKKNLEQDLEFKNKELTTNVMYLLKKNELMSDVSDRLVALKYCLKKENVPPIQQILLALQSGFKQDVWKEFELRFGQIHSDFYKKLQEKFPELSPAEKKLAAFLKLSMSSKEIASITGQSTRSLEVARYRLRKKLGIANKEVNLVNFLSEL